MIVNELPIQTLKRISPSRFCALRKCKLREVWASSGQAALLSSSPSAYLGRAIHEILDKAGKGGFAKEEDFEQVWQDQISLIEEKLLRSAQEKHFVPLETSCRKFTVKKLQCKILVKSIMGRFRPSSLSGGSVLTEKWVETDDKTIGGKIDKVIERNDFVEIIDYKSGSLVSDDDTNEIKPEYLDQLWLYAALYETQFGRPPTKLTLIGLDGGALNVEFTVEQCESLLVSATKLLCEVNNIIESVGNYEDRLMALASPSPEACKFCVYRPACHAYLKIRVNYPLISDWPMDVMGKVSGLKRLGNGRYLLRMLLQDGTEVSVRGLSPDRHSSIGSIGNGQVAAVFSVSPDVTQGCFIENRLTMLYNAIQ